MKRILPGILSLFLAACTAAASDAPAAPSSAPYPDLGPAPELANDTWLNVDAPLRLAGLRGRVVAIDMWTFG
jgi:hypothetical protein